MAGALRRVGQPDLDSPVRDEPLGIRALRRAGLPVAFTEGFTPRPKISFGLALPTGAESIAEYVDIELQRESAASDIDLETLPARLTDALPAGFDVLVAGERELARHRVTAGRLRELIEEARLAGRQDT